MYDHPTAAELIAAARMQLEQQVIPSITEPRLRFQTLVTANVLAIVERELAAGEAHRATAWQRAAELQGDAADQPTGEALRAAIKTQARQLCADIRAGVYDDEPRRRALLAHLRRSAEEELLVANPRFLERMQG
jgi:Domain of unknown function (DUF6285)